MDTWPELDQLPIAKIPAAIAFLAARLAEAQRVQAPEAEPAADRWLTAEEAANLLNVTTRWLYRRRLPFVKRLSRKCVRFSETGLRKWAASNRP
jgi:hypothetical protein